MKTSILPIDPASYVRHRLHGEDRDWIETNCYVDVWIELLHALGHEPIAALPFTFGIDFEGDQWTFFKYPLADLYDLYGIDVQELNIWRSLIDQVEEQVRLGRPVLVEVDSYYLPDTAGTSYRTAHVKTTVAVQELDQAAHHLGYFHAQGYYHLAGEDFVRIFRLDIEGNDDGWLPPYVEFAKLDPARRPSPGEVLAGSRALLTAHMKRRPVSNPVVAFRRRFDEDLAWLKEQTLESFHQYSFATLRQIGACAELASTYLHWLADQDAPEFTPVAGEFAGLSGASKTLQFKLARVVGRKRELDFTPMLDEMETRWSRGMEQLDTLVS